jgi:hypothetical protein
MTFSPLEPPPVSILASALLAELNFGSALVHQLLLHAQLFQGHKLVYDHYIEAPPEGRPQAVNLL